MKRLTLLLLLTAFTCPAWATLKTFDAGRAGFSVGYKSLSIPYEFFAIYGLPKERLVLQLPAEEGSVNFNIEFNGQSSSIANNGAFNAELPPLLGSGTEQTRTQYPHHRASLCGPLSQEQQVVLCLHRIRSGLTKERNINCGNIGTI